MTSFSDTISFTLHDYNPPALLNELKKGWMLIDKVLMHEERFLLQVHENIVINKTIY